MRPSWLLHSLHFSENLHCTYVILHFRIVQYEYAVICTGPGIKQEMLQWYLHRPVAQRHPLPFEGIWKQDPTVVAIPPKKSYSTSKYTKRLCCLVKHVGIVVQCFWGSFTKSKSITFSWFKSLQRWIDPVCNPNWPLWMGTRRDYKEVRERYQENTQNRLKKWRRNRRMLGKWEEMRERGR